MEDDVSMSLSVSSESKKEWGQIIDRMSQPSFRGLGSHRVTDHRLLAALKGD